MKILYLVNHLKHHGGIEKMISLKVDAWKDNFESEVIVVAMNQGEEKVIYPPRNDYKFIDLGLPNINTYNVKQLFSFFRKVKNVINRENPDLIVSVLSGLPALILPFIKSKGKKALEIHTLGSKLVSGSWRYKWWILHKYDYVVLLSEDERKFFKLNNIKIIPNFLYVDYEKKLNYNYRDKVIVSAGRINTQKQFLHAIKVWENIYMNHPDWKFEIYGDGDENLLKEYQSYILHNGIERIRFNPGTTKIQQTYENSSIYCMTSDYECFPMVLLECKTAMLPAVSYDLPNGPSRIIMDDGILVENKNIKKLSEVLSNLINNDLERKKMAEKAFENRVHFSAEKIIQLWYKLL